MAGSLPLPSPPFPFPIPSPPSPPFLPPLPLEVEPPIAARGSGSAWAPQRSLGQSPSRNWIWCILALKSDIWWQQIWWFSWEQNDQISCIISTFYAKFYCNRSTGGEGLNFHVEGLNVEVGANNWSGGAGHVSHFVVYPPTGSRLRKGRWAPA